MAYNHVVDVDSWVSIFLSASFAAGTESTTNSAKATSAAKAIFPLRTSIFIFAI
jgi:hypothetical protein